jgi:hypothetical protein
MIWFHLFDSTNTWVGQFRTVAAIEAYVRELGADINDFRVDMGDSRYPSN